MRLRGDLNNQIARNYWPICCIACINKTNLSFIFLKKNISIFSKTFYLGRRRAYVYMLCHAMHVCVWGQLWRVVSLPQLCDQKMETRSPSLEACAFTAESHQLPRLLLLYCSGNWDPLPPTNENTLKYISATGDRQDFEDMQRVRPHNQSCLLLYPGLLCS